MIILVTAWIPGVTADVITRDSQGSSGYWEIVQDSLADLIRIQQGRCYDKEGHPDLYNYVRGLRGGAVWLVAFPNLFIPLALAEWRFPLPYFLQPYKKNICAGSYLITPAYFLSPLHHLGFSCYAYGQSMVHSA